MHPTACENKRARQAQRGGVENVWVKREVPWPQNYILGGPTKLGFPTTPSQ